VNAREAQGVFRSLEDVCRRIDLRQANRKVLESLIKAGACDSLGAARAALFARLDQSLEEAAARQRDQQTGQFTLFESFVEPTPEAPEVPAAPPASAAAAPDPAANRLREWPESQKLAFERALLGFYVSGHPLARYEQMIRALANSDSKQLMQAAQEARVIVGGMLSRIKLTTTKKTNEQMAVCMLEDFDGDIEIVIFPAAFPQLAPLLKPSSVVFVEGRAAAREDRPRLLANQIIPVEQAMIRLAKAIELVVRTPGVERQVLEAVRQVLHQHPGPTPIYMKIDLPGTTPVYVKLPEELCVEPRPELFDALGRVLGPDSITIRRQPLATADNGGQGNRFRPWKKAGAAA
jgi:DNA polymerase-3 subunit alpha